MGMYVDCPSPKTDYIVANYSGKIVPQEEVKSYYDKGFGVICVVHYRYDAAGFMYSPAELADFMNIRADKTWVVGDYVLFKGLAR